MPIDDYFKERFEKEILPVIEEKFPENYASAALYYTLGPGKNRFRSVLPLVTAEITGFDAEKAKVIGAVAELAWTGIIMHDDIIDFDTARRGRPSAHLQFSMNSALCSGVLGLVDGPVILCSENLSHEVQPYCEAVSRTYQGQILHQQANRTTTQDQLYNIYQLKTSLGVWALASATKGQPSKNTVYKFCTLLGEAGQIKDDLDDLFTEGEYEVSMRDLGEGIYNLPFVLFYSRADKEDILFMDQYFGKKGAVAPKEEIVRRLARYGIINQCQAASKKRIERAVSLLGELPDKPDKAVLREWAEAHSVKKYTK